MYYGRLRHSCGYHHKIKANITLTKVKLFFIIMFSFA